MLLYIANVSNQNQTLNFRLPESDKVMTQPIDMGRQQLIGDRNGFSGPQLDAILHQLGIYGLRSVTDGLKAEGVVPYVYSTDSPVKPDVMMKLIHHNRGVLSNGGRIRREQAAVAANAAMASEETPLRKLEMSIEEDANGPKLGDEPVGEGYIVDNTANTNENTNVNKRAAGKKRNA